MTKKKMCYIAHGFKMRRVTDEIDTLKENYDLLKVDLSKGKFKSIIKIFKHVPRCDFVYSWHCNKLTSLAVFLSKVFKKRSFVVVSGHEAAALKHYRYGGWGPWIDRIFVRYNFKHASKILPVSKFLYDEVVSRVRDARNIFLLYASVDLNDFVEPDYSKKKDNLVVMVCGIKSSYLWRKGLEVFVRLGYYLPEYEFVVVGRYKSGNTLNYLKSISPGNVRFTGFVSNDELKSILDSAKVMCLLSCYEAFGSVLVEGMSKGCVPVVTCGFNDFENIVGDTGLLVGYNDIVQIRDAVKKASEFDTVDMKRCHDRVKNMFSMDIRLKQLLKIFEV